MQERKNTRLIILLLILIIVTSYAYWFIPSGSSFAVDKTIFRVDDLNSINKITFDSKRYGNIELKFNGARWRINDKFDADRNLVEVLFATLKQAEPKRPMAFSLKDSVSQEIKNNGVKIVLFAGDRIVKSFYAGGNADKTQAYFKTEEGDPYIMVVPGYHVYTSGILELTENGWRDKRIFNFNWRNFKTLSATFFGEPKQDFKIEFQDKYFGVEGLTQIDTTKLNTYLDHVSLLEATNFITPGMFNLYDSLMNTLPAVKIEVRDVADSAYSLVIYHHAKGNPMVLGKAGNEFALFNFGKVAQIVKGKDYFK